MIVLYSATKTINDLHNSYYFWKHLTKILTIKGHNKIINMKTNQMKMSYILYKRVLTLV